MSDYANLSHLKVCGKIGSICYPRNAEEIQQAYKFAQNNNLIPFPLGAGSNTLIGHCKSYFIISDKKLEKVWEIEATQESTDDLQKDVLYQKKLIVSANTNINDLIMKAANENLGGLEFLAGIPAHLGGLINMNAGAEGQNISDFLEWITVVDEQGERKINKDDIIFEYRQSNINGFITKACLNLNVNDYSEVENENIKLHKSLIKQHIIHRKKKQPLNMPNLGCFFKNSPKYPAGLLIDTAGLKSFAIGGAMVSPVHANFLVNTGNATFEDFINLIDHVKETIINKYNISLELEVRILNG
jgi:UDP-N-acetylmuramate dehydrogenase